MTNDLGGIELALLVIAACFVVQTTLVLGGAIGAWLAYRRMTAVVDEQLRVLQSKTDDIAATVQQAADAVGRGTEAFRLVMDDARTTVRSVSDVVDGARDSVRTVSNLTGTVAVALKAPRSAAAYGVMRGVQWWRRRRQARQQEPPPIDVTGVA